MLSVLQCFRKTTKMKICAFVVVKIKQLLNSKCYFIDDNFNLRARELFCLFSRTHKDKQENTKLLKENKETTVMPDIAEHGLCFEDLLL